MSRFSGPGRIGRKWGKNKLVMSEWKDKLRGEAIERQQKNIDRGFSVVDRDAYRETGYGTRTPAPISEFLPKADR